jgi:hypothetical protein
MIRIRGRAAVYGEVWYDEKPSADSAVDIVLYRQQPAPIARARHSPFLSLVTDLGAGESAIADGFSKECRYEIRRAENKDALDMEFIGDPQSRLGEFHAFYDAFAQQKGLAPSDRQWLLAACEARQLLLTSASRHGEALVWHAYVMCGQVARLQYSASCFRNRQSDYRALVGRANRWLHWRDLARLGGAGVSRYDWGGLFEDESTAERAGINRFKKGFGGQPQRSYDCTVPVTVRGRLYLPLRDAWRRRRVPAK